MQRSCTLPGMAQRPVTVAALFRDAGIAYPVTIPWGLVPPVPLPAGGIYVVSLRDSIVAKQGRAAPRSLPADVSARWHRDQPVIYIGKTERNLRVRLREFYGHTLGNISPHRGGEDVLRLRDAHWRLWVHWQTVPPDRAVDAESRMLQLFALGLSDTTGHQLPFANRQRGRRVLRTNETAEG